MAKENLFGLSTKEISLFKRLNTPEKIQNFLNTIPQNFETKGETCMSPRQTLLTKKAHCIEGALLGASILWYHGHSPLVMHLATIDPDQDHVVTIFKKGKLYGAISKTNHAVLRYRDPIYKNARELVLSYFHEYFLNKDGTKTLLGHTDFINLKKFGTTWITSPKNLWNINDALFHSKHHPIVPLKLLKSLRKAEALEREAGKIVDWPRRKLKKSMVKSQHAKK